MWIDIWILNRTKKSYIKIQHGGNDTTNLNILQDLMNNNIEWKKNILANGGCDWGVRATKENVLYYLKLINQSSISRNEIGDDNDIFEIHASES